MDAHSVLALRMALNLSETPQLHLIAYRNPVDTEEAVVRALAEFPFRWVIPKFGTKFSSIVLALMDKSDGFTISVLDLRHIGEDEASVLFQWLNRNRDVILGHLHRPLVIVGNGDTPKTLGWAAPDFWSCLTCSLMDPAP